MATRIHDPAVRTGVAGAGSAVPRDLTRVVDRDGLTERSPKGAEVPQPPLGPNEGVAHRSATAATRRTRCDGAEPGHLPSDVHGNRLAEITTERSQVLNRDVCHPAELRPRSLGAPHGIAGCEPRGNERDAGACEQDGD